MSILFSCFNNFLAHVTASFKSNFQTEGEDLLTSSTGVSLMHRFSLRRPPFCASFSFAGGTFCPIPPSAQRFLQRSVELADFTASRVRSE